jgi:hypothetical protein
MTNEAQSEERASLVKFLMAVKGEKSFEPKRSLIRVVSKGLFVDERVLADLTELYQGWILKESDGVAQKSLEKCRQRLFEGKQPERMYLVEGRAALAGFVIPIPLQHPQQFGLPFYLGSLLSTKDYLHPSDPVLATLKGVEIRHAPGGFEAILQVRDKRVTVPDKVVRAFREQAQQSRFLQKRYPGSEANLAVSLRALAGLLRRARVVPRAFPLLVPRDVLKGKGKVVRAAGKCIFVEERGVLQRALEMNGLNLSLFLRAELQGAPREKLGSFRVTSAHRDILGFYQGAGKRTGVHARAFAEFAELIRRAREPRERFTGWFTAAECFEKFSSFFQLSQPIERRKIDQVLERFGGKADRFHIYGGWIFAISQQSTVMRTIAKHIRLPGHRRH